MRTHKKHRRENHQGCAPIRSNKRSPLTTDTRCTTTTRTTTTTTTTTTQQQANRVTTITTAVAVATHKASLATATVMCNMAKTASVRAWMACACVRVCTCVCMCACECVNTSRWVLTSQSPTLNQKQHVMFRWLLVKTLGSGARASR